MRLYGCCSAGAGRRAEPFLLLGVWLRAVLLESHTVLVCIRSGSRCLDVFLVSYIPVWWGYVTTGCLVCLRKTCSWAQREDVHDTCKNAEQARLLVHTCTALWKKRNISRQRCLLLTAAVYPSTCYYCVVLTTVYQFQSIFAPMLIPYYSSVIQLSGNTHVVTAVCARCTSSTLETQNENATVRHIHVQPSCDWYWYTPFNCCCCYCSLESHRGWIMELEQLRLQFRLHDLHNDTRRWRTSFSASSGLAIVFIDVDGCARAGVHVQNRILLLFAAGNSYGRNTARPAAPGRGHTN